MNDGTRFIGLGSQRAPSAHRIVDAGLPPMAWAGRRDATAPYDAKGAEAADIVAELGATCARIGVCVRDDVGWEEVGEQLVRFMRPRSTIAIFSAVQPSIVERLSALCAAKGVALLDVPVSGGAPGTEAGTLLLKNMRLLVGLLPRSDAAAGLKRMTGLFPAAANAESADGGRR